MFAKRDIQAGTVLVAHEPPMISFPQRQDINFCTECAAPIGCLRDHLPDSCSLLPLAEEEAQQQLANSETGDQNSEPSLVFSEHRLSCAFCSTVQWCSQACQNAGALRHSMTCCQDPLDHFINNNLSTACSNSCSEENHRMIFGLATQAITLALSTVMTETFLAENGCSSIDGKVQRLCWWTEYGSHPLWWTLGKAETDTSVKKCREESTKEYIQILSKTLLGFIDEQKARTKNELILKSLVLELCTLNRIGELLGMLQCNVMEYDFVSPAQQFMEMVAEQDGDETLPPSVCGTALFPVCSLANHDCDPNASIEFIQESNHASLVALRKISADEEITNTYVPNGDWDCGDEDGRRFEHFEPTRTWKWMKAQVVDEDCISEDDIDASSGTISGEDDTTKCSDQNEERFPEGWDPKERQEALQEYGFDCQCKRCQHEKQHPPTNNGISYARA